MNDPKLAWLIAGFYFLGCTLGVMVGTILGEGADAGLVVIGVLVMFFVSMGLSMYKVVKR